MNYYTVFCTFFLTLFLNVTLLGQTPASCYTETITSARVNTVNLVTAGANATDALEDSAILQAQIDALTAMPNGGVIYFPPGCYFLDDIIVKSNVHLEIDVGATIKPAVQANTTSNYQIFIISEPQIMHMNVSIRAINAVIGNDKFKVDLTGTNNTNVVVFKFGNVSNFYLGNFEVMDIYTKFSSVTFGLDDFNGSYKGPKCGTVENGTTLKSHCGYGLVQVQAGEDILFQNLSSGGGIALRLETGLSFNNANQIGGVFNIVGRNIHCHDGAASIMLSPHSLINGHIDICDVTSDNCAFAVRVEAGFVKPSQLNLPISPGSFASTSTIKNVCATYGTSAQLTPFKHIPLVPCDSYSLISDHPDGRCVYGPSIAPVTYSAANSRTGGNYTVNLTNIIDKNFPFLEDVIEDGDKSIKQFWTGASSCDWEDSGNWESGIVPGKYDEVIFKTSATVGGVPPSVIDNLQIQDNSIVTFQMSDLTVCRSTSYPPGVSSRTRVVNIEAGSTLNLDCGNYNFKKDETCNDLEYIVNNRGNFQLSNRTTVTIAPGNSPNADLIPFNSQTPGTTSNCGLITIQSGFTASSAFQVTGGGVFQNNGIITIEPSTLTNAIAVFGNATFINDCNAAINNNNINNAKINVAGNGIFNNYGFIRSTLATVATVNVNGSANQVNNFGYYYNANGNPSFASGTATNSGQSTTCSSFDDLLVKPSTTFTCSGVTSACETPITPASCGSCTPYSFSVTDPCNCDNPNNITLADGTLLLQDTLKVDVSDYINPTVTLSTVDANLLNSAGIPYTTSNAVFKNSGGGIYTLVFFSKEETPSSLTVSVNGDLQNFITASCSCLAEIPTMNQWGLLIFCLLILNLMIGFMYHFKLELL